MSCSCSALEYFRRAEAVIRVCVGVESASVFDTPVLDQVPEGGG